MLTSLGNLSIERGDAAAAAHAPATVVRAHFERGLEQLSGAKASYEAAFGREDHPKVITAVQGIAKAQAKLGNHEATAKARIEAAKIEAETAVRRGTATHFQKIKDDGPSAAEMAEHLRALRACSALSDASLLRLGEKAVVKEVPRFAAVYHEGASADALFLLLRGSVVLRAGVDVRGGRRLAPPAAFGLEALAGLGERRLGARLEGAVAAEPSLIARINKADFVGSLEHTRGGRAAVV